MSKDNQTKSTFMDSSIQTHPEAKAWGKAGFKSQEEAKTWVLTQATDRGEDPQALVEYARRFGVPAMVERVKKEKAEGIFSPLIAVFRQDEGVLSDILIGAISGIVTSLGTKVQAQVEEQVEARLKDVMATRLTIKVGEKPEVEVGLAHECFPTVFAILQEQSPSILLVGPAGSGKTFLAKQAADAAGIPFYSSSVCPQSTKSDLLGFVTLNGVTVSTDFITAYSEGGYYLLDEVDAGNPSVLLVLNSAIEQDYVATAHGVYKKHPNFRLIASANTIGVGGDLMYVGRNALDEAFRDRFAFIYMSYDRKLEAALHTDGEWTRFVWRIREVAAERRMRVLASTRVIRNGYAAMRCGVEPAQAANIAFWDKISAADATALRAVLEEEAWTKDLLGVVRG